MTRFMTDAWRRMSTQQRTHRQKYEKPPTYLNSKTVRETDPATSSLGTGYSFCGYVQHYS